jgi:Tol biopolymer transport system component
MRRLGILVFFACCILLAFIHRESDDFPVLKGPYLGQKPPGLTPELFAPGIITTDASEGCLGWGNEMEYFIFQRWVNGKSQLYIMNQKNGVWSDPELLPFVEKYQVGDYMIAPDGKTMVFASRKLIEEIGPDSDGANMWIVEKTETRWTEPKPFGLGINTKFHESYPCLTANRNLYFFSRRPGGYGDSDLYLSEFVGGKYQPPVNLGPKLNTEYHEWDTYTAPGENYMVYCSMKSDSLGSDDLYVTFKNDDGTWGDPVHMGDKINSDKSENRPYVSPDGKYLFYSSTKRGNRDIYWVDARIIEELKPDDIPVLKGPYLGQKPPGMTPEIFVPGVVSTEHHEFWPVFSPNGEEFYYGMSMRTGSNAVGYNFILMMKQLNNIWTKPKVASFSGKYWDMEHCFSYDGKKLYFCSQRPKSGKGKPDRNLDIWVAEKTGLGWSNPTPLTTRDLGESIMGPSVSKNGNLYFSGNYADPDGKWDIYLSRFINGEYQKPENLGNAINSEFHEGHVFVCPDESYVIFDSNKPGGFGKTDLYISFRGKDGSWMKAKNMGDKINSDSYDIGAFVTHDEKYLFFNSRRNKIKNYSEKAITYEEIIEKLNNPQNGNGDIYWVDAKIIEGLKLKNGVEGEIHET